MTVTEDRKIVERKRVLVGINLDRESRELLNWALVKVAEPGDRVIAVHVCRCPDDVVKDNDQLDGYLKVYDCLCCLKNVELTGEVFTGRSTRKTLLREAKNHQAVAVVVGVSKHNSIGGWLSTAKYFAKRLPICTDVLAINNGKIVFRRCPSVQLPDQKVDLESKLCLRSNDKENQSELGDSVVESSKSTSMMVKNTKHMSNQIIESVREEFTTLVQQELGWPLLHKQASVKVEPRHAPRHSRSMSVVQWVMSLPDRSPQQSPHCYQNKENPFERNLRDIEDEIPNSLEDILKAKSSDCKFLNYELLSTCTSQFSSETLIGKGGSNRVYKGNLPDGKQVAVKVLRSSKEAMKDFVGEVEIICSLKHKNITPLLGISMEDNALISVYDFFPRGSLEEYLHGKRSQESCLSWEARFNIAIGVAEALRYLHKECTRPVIHRDVKSSNILLSDQLEPQLSDFGLAIWGPTSSSSQTQEDIVGTFGYLAPEYFMYGKVSDKIDVYAFGVVLLELISGRKPIGSDTPKGQESLVMWAIPIIENDDVKDLLDPNLDEKFDEDEMQRMVHAASLCITRSARIRPHIGQILEILKGNIDIKKFKDSIMDNHLQDSKRQENADGDGDGDGDDDDEVYPNSRADLHLSLALLDVEDDSTSLSSLERSSPYLEEYLKSRCSRSSSFD